MNCPPFALPRPSVGGYDTSTPCLVPPVTVREIIKQIEADGWYLARQRGSHRQYKHPTKPGLVTVAGPPSATLAPKTLKSVLRQAGLST